MTWAHRVWIIVVAVIFAFFVVDSRNLFPEYNFEFVDGATYFALGVAITYIGVFVIKNTNMGLVFIAVLYLGLLLELSITKLPSYAFKTAMLFLSVQLVAMWYVFTSKEESDAEKPLERGNMRNNLVRILGAICGGIILSIFFAASLYYYPNYSPSFSDAFVYIVLGFSIAHIPSLIIKNMLVGYGLMFIVYCGVMFWLANNPQPAVFFQMAMLFLGLEAGLTWLNILRENEKRLEKQKRLDPVSA